MTPDSFSRPRVDNDVADARTAALWRAAERLVELGLDDVDGISYQGLGALAADLLERRGSPIPHRLLHHQRMARVAAMTAPALLTRVRAACDGPIVLLKGPEVAERYPQRARGYGDLDLLVPDGAHVQRALVEDGFSEVPDPERFVGVYHLPPLILNGAPLALEIHEAPNWPEGLTPPPSADLIGGATESALRLPGILAPAASHHALLLAAHAWSHAPLGRVRDLLDVGAILLEADDGETSRLAEAWGVPRLWQTTTEAINALVSGGRTWPLRLWAAHIPAVRAQNVLEEHLQRVLSPFWGYGTGFAARRSASAFLNEFQRASDETWPEKIGRSAVAVRRALTPTAKHRRLLGDSATRGQRRNTPPGPLQ